MWQDSKLQLAKIEVANVPVLSAAITNQETTRELGVVIDSRFIVVRPRDCCCLSERPLLPATTAISHPLLVVGCHEVQVFIANRLDNVLYVWIPPPKWHIYSFTHSPTPPVDPGRCRSVVDEHSAMQPHLACSSPPDALASCVAETRRVQSSRPRLPACCCLDNAPD